MAARKADIAIGDYVTTIVPERAYNDDGYFWPSDVGTVKAVHCPAVTGREREFCLVLYGEPDRHGSQKRVGIWYTDIVKVDVCLLSEAYYTQRKDTRS